MLLASDLIPAAAARPPRTGATREQAGGEAAHRRASYHPGGVSLPRFARGAIVGTASGGGREHLETRPLLPPRTPGIARGWRGGRTRRRGTGLCPRGGVGCASGGR